MLGKSESGRSPHLGGRLSQQNRRLTGHHRDNQQRFCSRKNFSYGYQFGS